MSYLIEDPTYVLAALGLVAVVLLVALRVTQQGKFLIWAGLAGLVAAAFFGFERYWVTDTERIEAVVHDLAGAIRASDGDRIESHLDGRVTIGMNGQTRDASIPIGLALPLLRRIRFDFVRISRLHANAGGQARRGSAEFAVTANGTFDEAGARIPVPPVLTEWSLGFREASPGVWKVNRISAIKVPRDVSRYLFGGR